MEEFRILQDRVRNGTATPDERIEYYRKVQSGYYDHLIEEDFDAALKESPLAELPRSRSEPLRQIHKAHISPITAGSILTRVLATAAVVVSVTIAGVWVFRSSDGITSKEEDLVYRTHTGRHLVNLPDGSIVVLNDSSEIRYDETSDQRHVILYGEAYFDVVHNPRKPFIVQSGIIVTRVLGTSFSVNAYPDKPEMRVSVISGKVMVGDSVRSFGTLTDQQEFTIDRETGQPKRTDQQSAKSLAWTSKHLIMDDVDLDEAGRLIKERYHVAVIFDSDDLSKEGINATFVNDEPLTDMLDMLTAAISCHYTVKGDTVVIFRNPSGKSTHQ